MRVRFWGVRGSLPVPGRRTERYGGNTSCVEVVTAAGTRIVIDAGTGIRGLGKDLMRTQFGAGTGEAHLLVSHTHWDHIQGLPFFAPLYQAGNRLCLYTRRRDDRALRTVLDGQADSPYFPVPAGQARAQIDFRELEEDEHFHIADAEVQSTRLNHPNSATAYAITADGAKVAYVSDTAPFTDILFGEEFLPGPPAPDARLPPGARQALESMRTAVVRLCEGADLVIYDTMFTASDYRLLSHYGHSRPDDALDICRSAGARTLALYHHAPERSDEEVDCMLAEARTHAARQAGGVLRPLSVMAAFEGLDMNLGRV
jgi:phosphoribosyl 1,2-cyclic phosphodiesterase